MSEPKHTPVPEGNLVLRNAAGEIACTPGPWGVYEGPTGISPFAIHSDAAGMQTQRNQLALVYSEPNGKMMAAAPDLAAALARVIAFVPNEGNAGRARAEAVAALQKAGLRP